MLRRDFLVSLATGATGAVASGGRLADVLAEPLRADTGFLLSETGCSAATAHPAANKIVTVDEAFDNHGGPALAVDSQGFLHAVYYPHHHPFRYRRSVRPNDASAWEEETSFGERCTYPSLVCGRDDTLYVACREKGGPEWVMNLYTKPPHQDWRPLHRPRSAPRCPATPTFTSRWPGDRTTGRCTCSA